MLDKTRIEIPGDVLENADKCHIVTSQKMGVKKYKNFIINNLLTEGFFPS